jgi:hypothetical protein
VAFRRVFSCHPKYDAWINVKLETSFYIRIVWYFVFADDEKEYSGKSSMAYTKKKEYSSGFSG